MKKLKISPLLVLVCSLMLVTSVASAEKQLVDSVLVLDSSGSMKKTDPKGLRIPAAKMFVSLLNEGDRSSIVSFSDAGYPVVYLSEVGKHEKRLHKGAERISTKGVYTNLSGALEAGVRVLDREKEKNPRRFIILMSDGKMDLGDPGKEAALTQKIHQQIIPNLVEQKVKVYTIAFTQESDIALLKEIASKTGGLFHLAKSDKELHEIYTKIFEDGKKPDMLPIDNGEFMVDASIQEVTIVASKIDTSVKIALESPEGKRYTQNKHPKDMAWFGSSYFEMVTIRKPAQGKWRLFSSGKADKAYVVTDLGLATNLGEGSIATGSEATIAAWLEMQGHIVKAPEMLSTTKFNMERLLPGVGVDSHPLLDQGRDGDNAAGDGIVSNTLSFDKSGRYEITVRSVGATFQREKTFHIDVEPPAELSSPEMQAMKEEIIEEPIEELVEGEVPVEAEPELVEEEPVVEALSEEPTEPAADEHLQETHEEEVHEEETVMEEPPVEEEGEGASNAEIITWFLLANGLIALLIGAVVMLKKRKGKQEGEDGDAKAKAAPAVIEDEALDSLDGIAPDKEAASLDELAPDADAKPVDELDSLDDIGPDRDLDSLDDLAPDADAKPMDELDSLDELTPDTNEQPLDELDSLDDIGPDKDLESLDGLDDLQLDEAQREKADDELSDLDDLLGEENLDDLLGDNNENTKKEDEVDPLAELGEDLDDLLKDEGESPQQK